VLNPRLALPFRIMDTVEVYPELAYHGTFYQTDSQSGEIRNLLTGLAPAILVMGVIFLGFSIVAGSLAQEAGAPREGGRPPDEARAPRHRPLAVPLVRNPAKCRVRPGAGRSGS